MKTLGQLLTWLGAAVGVAVAVAMFAHAGLPGAAWLVNVALAKLGVISAFGLMSGGAVLQRLAARHENRMLAEGGSNEHTKLPR